MSNPAKEKPDITTAQFEKLLKEQTPGHGTKNGQTFRLKKYTQSQMQEW